MILIELITSDVYMFVEIVINLRCNNDISLQGTVIVSF